jgi:hypothetical protein
MSNMREKFSTEETSNAASAVKPLEWPARHSVSQGPNPVLTRSLCDYLLHQVRRMRASIQAG